MATGPVVLLDQKRAKKAWNALKGNVTKEYHSLARNFPSMIQSMGIGQSVAFLMAKDKTEHKLYLKHVTTWLVFDDDNSVPWTTPRGSDNDPHRLIQRLLDEDSYVWWHAEREAIEYAIWLKRFAEALYQPLDRSHGHAVTAERDQP